MTKTKKPQIFLVGLALFSMFFGSGNLIFPLMLGRDGGSDFYISALGFILSAIIIPFFGVLAIVKAQGDYEEIFSYSLTKKISKVFLGCLLIFFIPLGAGPRCVNLSFASLSTFILIPSKIGFSALFLMAVFLLVLRKNTMIYVLGRFLTPILLLCLLLMVIFAIKNGQIDPPLFDKKTLFFSGLFEGYNTQDLFSALFFSSSLLTVVRTAVASKKESIKILFQAAIVCVVLLGTLYFLIMSASAFHNDILQGKSGVELVSILANRTLGSLGIIASLAVLFACLTTEIAMVLAFSEYLNRTNLIKNEPLSIGVTSAIIFSFSLVDFDTMAYIVSSSMKILYPITLLLVIVYLVGAKDPDLS